jgi:hypothetical protein
MTLTGSHQDIIDTLLQDLEFPKLYRSYTWKEDTWKKGFPGLFRLEQDISRAARERALGETHLLEIAEWGGLRNKKRISCPRSIKIQLYTRDAPAGWLKRDPAKAVELLENQITGFGPTYSSRILRFAVPDVFGALDPRLVRTFGRGGEGAQRHMLLDLKATRVGTSWGVFSAQPGWPDEYGTWTRALNAIANSLNTDRIKCPHPKQYIQAGLRRKGTWVPADVETALFAYASRELAKRDRTQRRSS